MVNKIISTPEESVIIDAQQTPIGRVISSVFGELPSTGYFSAYKALHILECAIIQFHQVQAEPIDPAPVLKKIRTIYKSLGRAGLSPRRIAAENNRGILNCIVDMNKGEWYAASLLRNVNSAIDALGTLLEQKVPLHEVVKIFQVLRRNYTPLEAQLALPQITRIVAAEVPEHSRITACRLLNMKRTGVFDVIKERYHVDQKTLKFEWVEKFAHEGVAPELLYRTDGQGMLDQISSRYANGQARRAVNLLLDVIRAARERKVQLRTLNDYFNLVPILYKYNDLEALENRLLALTRDLKDTIKPVEETIAMHFDLLKDDNQRHGRYRPEQYFDLGTSDTIQ